MDRTNRQKTNTDTYIEKSSTTLATNFGPTDFINLSQLRVEYNSFQVSAECLPDRS